MANEDFKLGARDPAQLGDLRHHVQQIFRRQEQIAVLSHVSRRRGKLDLPTEDAMVQQELPHLWELARVETMNCRVYRGWQAACDGQIDGADHPVE